RISELNEQIRLREVAEQQLRALVEASPAALLVLDPAGKVVIANDAAGELLQCGGERLEGQRIDSYLPTLAELRKPSGVRRLVRTMLECTGYRRGGEAFLAHVWVSSTGPPSVTGFSAL